MSQTRQCKICLDPGISGQVNSLLETGVKVRVVAEQVGFSRYQLTRHTQICLAPKIADLSSDATGDDLQLWINRCTDAYHLAIQAGDSRSAIAACSAATRQLAALSKKQEREADAVSEQQAANDPNRPLSIAELDKLVAIYAEKVKRPPVCEFCGHERKTQT